MVRTFRSILLLGAVISSLAAGSEIRSYAADLPLPAPFSRQHRILDVTQPPPLVTPPQVPVEPTPQAPPAVRPEKPQPPDQLHNAIPVPREVEPRPVPIEVPPLPAMPTARVPPLDLKPVKQLQSSEVAVSSTVFGTVVELATLGLVFVAAIIVLLALPSILWEFDRLLDSPIQYGEGDVPLDSGTGPSAYDSQPLGPDLSAADIRNQTEVMRALKEALDADLASVRATIRHERLHAEQREAERNLQ